MIKVMGYHVKGFDLELFKRNDGRYAIYNNGVGTNILYATEFIDKDFELATRCFRYRIALFNEGRL